MKYIDMWFYYFLGVPACCAAQSACYGLRYRFGADRTMRASTHALRMPNAIVYACFYEGGGFAPALVVHRKTLKNKTLSKEERCYPYLVRVRDSSEKPATGVACEVQTWHATSLPAYSPTPKRGDTPKKKQNDTT